MTLAPARCRRWLGSTLAVVPTLGCWLQVSADRQHSRLAVRAPESGLPGVTEYYTVGANFCGVFASAPHYGVLVRPASVRPNEEHGHSIISKVLRFNIRDGDVDGH